jgi:hypothetical protein
MSIFKDFFGDFLEIIEYLTKIILILIFFGSNSEFLFFFNQYLFCHYLFTPCSVFFFGALASFRDFARFYFSENEKN